MTIFTDIPLHGAVVRSLENLVPKIGAVDQIEDDKQAADLCVLIAITAEAAIDYFTYVRDRANRGVEIRLGPRASEARAFSAEAIQ